MSNFVKVTKRNQCAARKRPRKPPVPYTVVVIEPTSPRGSMWPLYASGAVEDIQAIFDDHHEYMVGEGEFVFGPRFTAFALRERGCAIYRLALVFRSPEDFHLFRHKSFGLRNVVAEAEWKEVEWLECERLLVGKEEELRIAKSDLVNDRNIIVF